MPRDTGAARRKLFGLPSGRIKYDLERIRGSAKACGNPQRAYPCIHVAGTNGKGSVCAFIESCIRASGIRTGLFTSPHLVRFEERFMLDGRPVEERVWHEVYCGLRREIERFNLSFFEASALIAFELFRREKVGWAVFEAGLGGRLDATNVVEPAVSVISRIAVDHCEYLGADRAAILSEKLGIVKKCVPLVMSDPGDDGLKELAVRRCGEMGAMCSFISSGGSAEGELSFGGREYRIMTAGEFQTDNALLALSALEAAGLYNMAAARGLAHTQLPGRFQILSVRGRTMVFDVGHNPDAAHAFCRSFSKKFGGRTACFVTGIMRDKDIAGILSHYADTADRIICTAPAAGRSAVPDAIRRAVPDAFKGDVSSVAGVASAVEEAFNSPEEILCVAGSFFTVGEAMSHLNIEPYGR